MSIVSLRAMSFRIHNSGAVDGDKHPAQLAIDEEDERLHQLGIRRELRKEFTNFSTISFALGILGLEISPQGPSIAASDTKHLQMCS